MNNFIELTKCDSGKREDERYTGTTVVINKFHITSIEDLPTQQKSYVVLNNSCALYVRENYKTILENMNES